MMNHRILLALAALVIAPFATTAFAQTSTWELNLRGGALRHDVFADDATDLTVGGKVARYTAGGWGFGGTFDWARAESGSFVTGPDDSALEIDADLLRYAFVIDKSFKVGPRTHLALGSGVGAATARFGGVAGMSDESRTNLMVPVGGGLTFTNRSTAPSWGVTLGVRDDVIFVDESASGTMGARDKETVHHVQGTVGVSLFFGGGGKKVAERPRTEPAPSPSPSPAPVADDDSAEREARARALAEIREKIFFDFDRSEIKAASRETLQRKAEALRELPEVTIVIEGHADERGTVEYNLALGERRGKAALDYLTDLGIDPERISIVSYGEERPAVEGSGEAVWSQNRRDEFVPSGN